MELGFGSESRVWSRVKGLEQGQGFGAGSRAVGRDGRETGSSVGVQPSSCGVYMYIYICIYINIYKYIYLNKKIYIGYMGGTPAWSQQR